MFNERNPQIDNAYLETSKAYIDVAGELAKIIIELAKALKEAWKEKQEEHKIALKVGEETFNLVEDKDEPGAYKWEKVDLNNEQQSEVSSSEQPFSEYQAQTLATNLISEAPDNTNYENLKSDNPAIQVVSLDSEKETILYEMSERGNTVKNAFTETLTQKEIIDVAYEPLANILPPNSPLLLEASKDDIEKQKDFNITADEMLSQIVDTQETIQDSKPQYDNDGLVVESDEENKINQSTKENFLETNRNYKIQYDNDSLVVESNENNISQTSGKVSQSVDKNTEAQFDSDGLVIESDEKNIDLLKQKVTNEADFIAGAKASEVSINEPENTAIIAVKIQTDIEKISSELVEDNSLIIEKVNQTEVEEEFFKKKTKSQDIKFEEDIAANYTYKQVADNKEVEPRAQQWARQSTIPIEKIKHKGERNKVNLENNQNIAKAATEMLKKYGTIENDGSRIYRSDAFTIRKVDGVISIHRRNDEAKGFKEPLMEFKLDNKGVPDIKSNKLLNKLKRDTTRNEMLPVEKQEFLVVAEQLNEGKSLPNLQSGDIREIANALGSLAPAGSLKTLETFKKTEMLEMLNSTLNQLKSDEITTGEFTIKRERDPENNRASLTLTKDSQDGRDKKELVRFNLEKTPEGIKSEVTKMNISDYDIGQVKYISQNAYKLDDKSLESNFDDKSIKPEQPLQQNASPEINTKSIGDIPVDIHPWIAEEWQNMSEEKPLWGEVVEQGNDEIIQKLEQNEGKLPIADQREMYDKIIMHKITQAQATGDEAATIDYAAKKDITSDLMQKRKEAIKSNFTPTENISQKAKATKRDIQRPVKNISSKDVEL